MDLIHILLIILFFWLFYISNSSLKYVEVHLLLEPLQRGEGLIFDNRCSEDVLAKNWQRLVMTHLEEKVHNSLDNASKELIGLEEKVNSSLDNISRELIVSESDIQDIIVMIGGIDSGN